MKNKQVKTNKQKQTKPKQPRQVNKLSAIEKIDL